MPRPRAARIAGALLLVVGALVLAGTVAAKLDAQRQEAACKSRTSAGSVCLSFDLSKPLVTGGAVLVAFGLVVILASVSGEPKR